MSGDEHGQASRPTSRSMSRPTLGVVGVALVVLGLLLWLAYRLAASGEDVSYAPGASPPADFALTRGQNYGIDLPGGTATVTARLADPAAVSCTITPRDSGRAQLAVTPTASGSRALHRIATFVSPVSGRARIDCTGLPAVFVDDADDAGPDLSGLALVLASIALAVGIALIFSAMRSATRDPQPAVEG